MFNDQVIVSRATPSGPGALAIIRASGAAVLEVAESFVRFSKPGVLLSGATPAVMYHARIFDELLLVDEVMLVSFVAPRSFTGENSLEITCHNNSIIISNIINLFLQNGARLAEPGEYSRRAFLNGKMDLSQAEAICEIVSAQNQIALQAGLGQLQGSLTSVFNELTLLLLSLCATIEASFEFSEEEHLDLDLDNLFLAQLTLVKQKLAPILWSCSKQHKIRDGVRIVFAGSTNAGKSTIFNAMLRKNRALVSNIPGTTRDVIEDSLCKNSALWTFADTAGIRACSDMLEQLGIDKSFQELVTADIILFVIDASKKISTEELKLFEDLYSKYAKKFILLFNKIDLDINASVINLKTIVIDHLEVSGITGENLQKLELLLEKKVENIFSHGGASFILNQRQQLLAKQLETSLCSIEEGFSQGVPHEVIVLWLKELLELFGNFTGKGLSEALLDKVFSSFCIGK